MGVTAPTARRNPQHYRMAYPVQDLRAYLAGQWRITRRIRDIRQGLTGRLSGSGSFVPAPRALIYEERGLLRFGGYQGEAAWRCLFAFDGIETASVHHADGNPFHRLNLSSGQDEVQHLCGKDHYRGRYRVLDPDSFIVNWNVAGARKNYRMATIYARARAVPVT